jgi:hypothetical protein
MLNFFTAPVTGDVWLQDGQIKEEEEGSSARPSPFPESKYTFGTFMAKPSKIQFG